MNATWVDTWAVVLWRATWQGGAALLLVWGTCAAFRRVEPRVKCWLWRLGYLKFAAALLLLTPIALPLLPSQRVVSSEGSPLAAATVEAPLPTVSATPEISPTSEIPMQVDAAAAGAVHARLAGQLSPREALFFSLFSLWMLGVLSSMVLVVRACYQMQVLRRRAEVVDDRAALDLLGRLAAQLGLRKLPRLLVGREGTGPLLAGVRRTAILVPKALLTDSASEPLRLALLHELAHLRRRDIQWNLLHALIETLFFFHPLIWLARRQSRYWQELACDQMTLEVSQATPTAYGHALLGILDLQQRTSPALAVGIADSAMTLRRRLLAMKTFRPASSRRAAAAALLISIVALAGILPWRVVAQTTPPAGAKGEPARPAATTPAVSPSDAAAVAAMAPFTDEVVRQLIPLRFAPNRMSDMPGGPTLSGIAAVRSDLVNLGFLGEKTKVEAVEKSNALIITGTSANVQRLAEILAEWEYEWANQRSPKPEAMPPRMWEAKALLSVPVAEVQSTLDSRIMAIEVKEGQAVKAGDVLFRLDDRAAKAAAKLAELNLNNAEIAYKDKAARVEVMGTQAEVDQLRNQVEIAKIQLEQARNALDDLVIRSPISGTVQTLAVRPNQMVTRAAQLTTIAGSEVEADITIPTGAARDLRVGQKFTLRAEGEPPATGEVDFISATSPMGSGALLVRGKVLSGDRLDHLKSGMGVNVYLRLEK